MLHHINSDAQTQTEWWYPPIGLAESHGVGVTIEPCLASHNLDFLIGLHEGFADMLLENFTQFFRWDLECKSHGVELFVGVDGVGWKTALHVGVLNHQWQYPVSLQ